MKTLNQLLEGAGIQAVRGGEVEVTALTHDSRKVEAGSLFFAISGGKRDGAKFIKAAIKRGAVAVVTQQPFKAKIPVIVAERVRRVMAMTAKAFSDNACDQLTLTAIVGTNGKTTTANILAHILKTSGKHVGVIGTLGIFSDGEQMDGCMTTPDPIEMHGAFSKMVADGVTHVVMEVSAHAIHFEKVAGVQFKTAIFTNVTQDHLDFFGTFENYSNTKINFFLNGDHIDTAVVNIDNQFGRRILAERQGVSVTYSLEHDADYAMKYPSKIEGCPESRIGVCELHPDKSIFSVCSKGEVNGLVVAMPARFNIYNAMSAAAAAREIGVGWEDIGVALSSLPRVDGRFNVYRVRDFSVVIDFAHSPDGLEKIIESVREILDNRPKTDSKPPRIFTVFGCGGNRDSTKRPLMGQIASDLSDVVIITSDNPRNENPMRIMNQIKKGCTNPNYVLIEDRTEAVKFALNKAREGDIVIIAGKGAEDYIEIRGEKIPYSDQSVVLEEIETVILRNTEGK
jgi:UDP-N-acetylmuramoyl-L-alanyl-D-glutamate--2,6-diaminopimelate ligase